MDTSRYALPAQVDPTLEPRSPLYLLPEEETWIGLDGPALRVSQEGCAERLYPLRRIGRVHTNMRADWEQDALLACAQAGIPVVFLDDGRVIARLLGRPGQRDELRSRLVEFLMRPEAEGMLAYWMERSRSRAARWAVLKLRVGDSRTRRNVPTASKRPADARASRRIDSPPPIRSRGMARAAGANRFRRAGAEWADPAEIRAWIDRTGGRLAGAETALRTRQWLRGLAYGWMEEHLADLGFGHTTEVAQSGRPALAADLTDILFWYLEPARIGWLERRSQAAQRKGEPVRPPTFRDTVALFESRAARVATRGREITGSLHRWLIREGG